MAEVLKRNVAWAALVGLAALAAVPSPAAARGVRRVFVDPVPQQDIQNWDDGPMIANERGIFVPQPKGTGETLDDSAGQGQRAQGDVVTTIRGDRIVGKVLTIESGGKLRLTAPHFEGEVVVLANAIDRIELSPKEKAKGDDQVALSNGDRVVGELAAITPDAVVLESKATGPLKIARGIVQGIQFSRVATTFLESAFDQGKIEPFSTRGGGWSVANGALQCMTQGNCQSVFAKFDQKEAVTMEVKVAATLNRYLHCELILFADNTEGEYGTNSIIGRFYASQFYLMWCQQGGCNSVTNRNLGNMIAEATLRLAYDPATGKVRAWVDSNDLGEYNVPFRPPDGRFVIFNARYPCRVSYIRVMQGIVGPTASDKQQEESDAHTIRFANKDRVTATDLTLAEGKLTLKTGFGDIASQIAKVQSISFRTKGVEKPRRRKGDILVETTDSRFTLQFDRLTEEHLIGNSCAFGDVKVRRDCIKAIRFNIYK
jgi:hypothetical protein